MKFEVGQNVVRHGDFVEFTADNSAVALSFV